MPKETVRWDKPKFNNFIAVPRIAKYELDPYEFLLYSHYIDETRWNSSCNQGTRTVAALINMSRKVVLRARKSLEEKGYLAVESGEAGDADLIILNAEIWQRNADKYERSGILKEPGVVPLGYHPGTPEIPPRYPGDTTSNIEDIKKQKKLIADAIDDAASPLEDDELARMVAAKAKLKPKAEPPVENHPDEDIIGHSFTKYLLDEFKVGTVTKTVLKELKKPILIKVEGAPEPVETGTLLYYYGHVEGFKEFVEEVVPIMANMPKQNMSLLNAIRFLANIEKQGGKLLHWKEWYEQNKRFIEPKHQPQKEKIKPVYGVEMPEEWKW